MAIRYVFIDESGQFGKYKSEKYFVVASFSTNNPVETAKKFRAWIRTKFPKKMRTQSEIKWSDSKISNRLRIDTLKYLARLNIEIRFTYLLKEDIPYLYYGKRGLESGNLFFDIIKKFLIHHSFSGQLNFIFDQRPLKGMSAKQFEQNLESYLHNSSGRNLKVTVRMVDSTSTSNLQIVDWIAGAIAWYMEKHSLGRICFDILKPFIIYYTKHD